MEDGVPLVGRHLEGESALIFAAGNGSLDSIRISHRLSGKSECVKWLLSNGAEVHFRKDTGDTALHYAAHNGHYKCVQLLLEAGASVADINRYVCWIVAL